MSISTLVYETKYNSDIMSTENKSEQPKPMTDSLFSAVADAFISATTEAKSVPSPIFTKAWADIQESAEEDDRKNVEEESRKKKRTKPMLTKTDKANLRYQRKSGGESVKKEEESTAAVNTADADAEENNGSNGNEKSDVSSQVSQTEEEKEEDYVPTRKNLRAGIPTLSAIKDMPNVREFDKSGNLSVYSYLDCDASSTDLTKKMRGAIYDTTAGFLLIPSLPYVDEVVFNGEVVENKVFARVSHEGTLLRAFYHKSDQDDEKKNSDWYLSTNRKLNAYDSRWGKGVSFGDLFDMALKETTKFTNFGNRPSNEAVRRNLIDSLNPRFIYYFLLLHTEESAIATTNEVRHIYLVAVVNKNTGVEMPLYDFPSLNENEVRDQNDIFTLFDEGLQRVKYFHYSNGSHIQTTERKPYYFDVSDLMDIINPSVAQGVILENFSGKEIKYLSPEYHRYAEARGMEPNILSRYLQVRCTEKGDLLLEMNEDLNHIEYILRNGLASCLYNAYFLTYVTHQKLTLPDEVHKIINGVRAKFNASKSSGGDKLMIKSELFYDRLNTLGLYGLVSLLKSYLSVMEPDLLSKFNFNIEKKDTQFTEIKVKPKKLTSQRKSSTGSKSTQK